jgi:hypothetical protein
MHSPHCNDREASGNCFSQQHSNRIPSTLLSPAALRAVVAEFVTRDGTDHSSVERRIETVMRQLDVRR